MPSFRHSSRIDTLGLKAEIIRKIGHQRANKYFHNLQRLLSLKLSKSEFDKVCIGAIGRENVSLHNQLIGSIINNACTAKKPPPKRTVAEDSVNVKSANGYHRSNLQSLLGDVLPPSPRKGRSSNLRDRKFRDRPSPLGPHYKVNNIISDESVNRTQEQQSATELVSLGSKPPVEGVSVEDGEEVEQVTDNPGGVQSRSPVRAPLGISIGRSSKTLRSSLLSASHPENCCNSYELPDSLSLRKRLERKLEAEGLGISMDCVNLLNNGLDAFLKRLIRPCMELARSRSGSEHLQQVNGQVIPGSHGVGPNPSFCASLLDFRAAMELNPQLLGEDWPVQLERLSFSNIRDEGVTIPHPQPVNR